MGSFNMADQVTGLTIERDQRAVALVIMRRTGGYPDAGKAAAIRPMSATHLFEPISIPIKGESGDYGQFVPDAGSLGARLVCGMTGVGSWQEFEEKGLSFQEEGLAIALSPLDARMGSEPHPRQIFGVAMFSEETWATLAKISGLDDDRQAALAAMNAIVEDAHAVLHGPKGDFTDRQMFAAINALDFGISSDYVLRDGSKVTPPQGMRALAHGEGGDLLADPAKQWITGASEVGERGQKDGYPSAMGDWVEGLWELQAGLTGMRYLGRTLGASASSGQRSNAEDIGSLGLGLVEQSAAAMFHQIEENDSEDLTVVQDVIDRLDRMREALSERLDVARRRIDSYGP